MACDILIWAYTMKVKSSDKDENEFRICVELDEGALFNGVNGDRDFEKNLDEIDDDKADPEQCPQHADFKCLGGGIYANRVILPGEGTYASLLTDVKSLILFFDQMR